jgi:hypothetical protein
MKISRAGDREGEFTNGLEDGSIPMTGTNGVAVHAMKEGRGSRSRARELALSRNADDNRTLQELVSCSQNLCVGAYVPVARKVCISASASKLVVAPEL